MPHRQFSGVHPVAYSGVPGVTDGPGAPMPRNGFSLSLLISENCDGNGLTSETETPFKNESLPAWEGCCLISFSLGVPESCQLKNRP